MNQITLGTFFSTTVLHSCGASCNIHYTHNDNIHSVRLNVGIHVCMELTFTDTLVVDTRTHNSCIAMHYERTYGTL